MSVFVVLFTIYSAVLSATPSRVNIPEDALMTFNELARKYARNTEEYNVMSKGGYILKVFRIPGDKTRPILFIHGAIDSSDSFIMRGNTSLAVMLARENYDIWAMNFRGNRYSRMHSKMNPDSDQGYWNFSLHELGYYDVPATIDFILNKTEENRLSVIGYSEGTTSMFVLGATRPEYNDKIKIFISLAPVCFMHNTGPYMSLLLQIAPLINTGLKAIRWDEFIGHNSITKTLMEEICNQKDIGYDTCLLNGLFLFTGSNANEIEPDFFPVIMGHFPAGTSRKNLNHLAQIAQKRKFANYDYGSAKNLAIYKSKIPPEYDLNKVTMKIALVVGKNDDMSTIKDVAILRKRLPNVVEYKVIRNNKFNHIDYIWGRNTYKILYPDILKMLNKYQ